MWVKTQFGLAGLRCSRKGGLGYVEGKNLIVQRYSGDGQEERFGQLARDVVHTGPEVIVTSGPALAMAFKTATPTIPIVGVAPDPVAYGLTTSVARGGQLHWS
jgi:putative tryptophan/tyrosine transport system substrate-binding protein